MKTVEREQSTPVALAKLAWSLSGIGGAARPAFEKGVQMGRMVAIGWIIVSLASSAAVSTVAAQPVVQTSDTQVVATGLTAGGKVAWLGIGREREGWTTRVTQWQDGDAGAHGTGQASPIPGAQAACQRAGGNG